MRTRLVTGGAGFIGGNFVLDNADWVQRVLDGSYRMQRIEQGA